MNSSLFRKWFGIFLLMAIFVLPGCSHRAGDKQEGDASVNGTTIHYETMGAGPPLMVVHGKPLLNMSYLIKPLQPLADNYRLIFYDQRANGRSSADVNPSQISVKNYVDDIEALRTSLNLGNIDLMGHSWGGFLAMKYALKYPSNVNKLILVSSMPPRSKVRQEEQIALRRKRLAGYRKQQQNLLSAKKYEHNTIGLTRALMHLRYKAEMHDTTKADSLQFYIPADFAKKSRLFGYLTPELQKYNLYPSLAKLHVPTLIIYGEDEPVAQVSGKKMRQTIPDAKLNIIPKAGHFPFIEQPTSFMQAVNKFLQDSTTAGR